MSTAKTTRITLNASITEEIDRLTQLAGVDVRSLIQASLNRSIPGTLSDLVIESKKAELDQLQIALKGDVD